MACVNILAENPDYLLVQELESRRVDVTSLVTSFFKNIASLVAQSFCDSAQGVNRRGSFSSLNQTYIIGVAIGFFSQFFLTQILSFAKRSYNNTNLLGGDTRFVRIFCNIGQISNIVANSSSFYLYTFVCVLCGLHFKITHSCGCLSVEMISEGDQTWLHPDPFSLNRIAHTKNKNN